MDVYDEQSKKILENMRKIKRKIAIVSGKGGVGKSVVAALIGSKLTNGGSSVGILDADITGPCIPKIFGINEKPKILNGVIVPPKSLTGIKIMSMNLLTEKENNPVIWRGPLVGKVVRQFLSEVRWGDLDYLIIDLPPGTGDCSLTIMQSLPLDGIVVVGSPPAVVQLIVEKAISMANSMHVPILGFVENMSGLSCPHCNFQIEPFGKSRVELVTAKNRIPLLGILPIDPKITELCDSGNIERYAHKNIDDIVEKIGIKLRGME